MRESDHADAAPLHTRALDVHEVRVWRLHKSLELVLLLLEFGRGVEEIDGESLGTSRGPAISYGAGTRVGCNAPFCPEGFY